FIMAPENTRDGADIPPERMQLLQAARRPYLKPFMAHEKAWVGCQWPTPALAQDAGMTLEQFTEFLFGAVLIDWDALEREMEKIEEFLREMLSTDEGASRLGEFGIGCNPGIQQHMRNTLFDEKIEGTIHLAMGNAYPVVGGTNESAIHWDMVKDLRRSGEIHLDGELVQRNGEWRL